MNGGAVHGGEDAAVVEIVQPGGAQFGVGGRRRAALGRLGQ